MKNTIILTAKRQKMVKYILIGVVLIAAVLLFFLMYPTHSVSLAPSAVYTVTIGTTTVQVEVESTDAAREQGLSGRQSLAEGSGMLFVFEQPGAYGFWMKDMNFALDMIFADAQGRIVTIVQNATPESYRQNPPQVFYPTAPIIYVLEVPAGFAAAHNIKGGMNLQFK